MQRIKLMFSSFFDFIAGIPGLADEINTEFDRGLGRDIVL